MGCGLVRIYTQARRPDNLQTFVFAVRVESRVGRSAKVLPQMPVETRVKGVSGVLTQGM